MLARYIGRDSHKLPLIAPGLKYNKGAGLRMCLEVGAGTAGSVDGMHCELVDTRATKPDAVIWGHNDGIVVNKATSIGPAGGKGESTTAPSSTTSSDDGWSFSSSTEVPTTTAPAVLSSSDDADIIATSYITTGNTVVELAIEQVEVTVTATPSAGTKHKRHMDKHRHAHRRR